MKAGKLKESVLKRSVLKQLHIKTDHLAVGPGVGRDAGIVDAFNDAKDCSISIASDPVILEDGRLPGDAIIAACNNVSCTGATPIGVSVVLLLTTETNEQELRDMIKDIEDACRVCDVDIVSGHTEVTRAVKSPIITVTAIGILAQNMAYNFYTKDIKPGSDIVITKWIGMEGAALLAREREEELRSRYAQPFIDKAKIERQMMSILPEAAVAMKCDVSALHDVSEGGVFGALWEMAESAGIGLEIDLKKIPIRQETIEICEFFDENPYKIVSGGSLLIATEDGNGLVMELEKNNIPAVVIGKATSSKDRVLINEDERRFLERN